MRTRNVCGLRSCTLCSLAEIIQAPDRLLAGRLARESSNSWMMEGNGGEGALEDRAKAVQASSGEEEEEEEEGRGLRRQKTAALMCFGL